MIRSNLAVLLAERNLKITKVSVDTGISRTTLTALCNNYSQGIQFDTLNELCLYLDVDVSDFITFTPVDVAITEITMTPYTGPGHRQLHIFADIRDRRREYRAVCLDGYLVEHEGDSGIDRLELVIDLPDANPDHEDSVREKDFIRQSFQKLPRSFFSELERVLEEKLLQLYSGRQLAEKLNVTFIWSDKLIRRGGR